jgi:hypothetical protein
VPEMRFCQEAQGWNATETESRWGHQSLIDPRGLPQNLKGKNRPSPAYFPARLTYLPRYAWLDCTQLFALADGSSRDADTLRAVLWLTIMLSRVIFLFRRVLLVFGICVGAFLASAQAQQVAFIGDDLTYHWQQTPQFQDHHNWLAYGFEVPSHPSAGNGTRVAYAQLENILASGQRPIIHLLVGQADLEGIDSGGDQAAFIFAAFATNMERIISTAQAANLKIIVGTIPYAAHGDLETLNQWLFLYCNSRKVPVVNYAFALNSGKGFAASRPGAFPAPVYYNPRPDPNVEPLSEPSLTSAGYDLITEMAATQIGLTSGAFHMTGGYLQSVTLNALEDPEPTVNGNSLFDAGVVQFTPWGTFSDGKARVLNNANQFGHVGTWSSSAPNVVLMDQYGVGTACSKGTANVHFTSNLGLIFKEWTMYVEVWDPSNGTFSNY